VGEILGRVMPRFKQGLKKGSKTPRRRSRSFAVHSSAKWECVIFACIPTVVFFSGLVVYFVAPRLVRKCRR
jgi:hypothetical protein